MADDEAEIDKLWRIRKTILQLCHDRGYMVTSDELEQSEQGENNNNPDSLLSIIINLGLQFLLSKTIILSVVLGSFFALSKTMFFKNMVLKIYNFFIKN